MTRRRPTIAVFIGACLAVALALAFVVSPEASSSPDGLNKVAIDEGFAGTETDHALADVPTAGYAVSGIDDERLSTGVAGVIGVLVTFGIAGGLFYVVGRRRPRAGTTTPAT